MVFEPFALLASGMAGLVAGAIAAGLRILSTEQRIRSLERQMTQCTSTCEQLETLMMRFDARDRMRKVRAGASDTVTPTSTTDGLPDPYKHPDEWRKAMTAKLAANGKR